MDDANMTSATAANSFVATSSTEPLPIVGEKPNQPKNYFARSHPMTQQPIFKNLDT